MRESNDDRAFDLNIPYEPTEEEVREMDSLLAERIEYKIGEIQYGMQGNEDEDVIIDGDNTEQVVGVLTVLSPGAPPFEMVYEECQLPMTNYTRMLTSENYYNCTTCKNIHMVQTLACISCKITDGAGKMYPCFLKSLWVQAVTGIQAFDPVAYEMNREFYFCAFRDLKTSGVFTLSPTGDVVGFQLVPKDEACAY